MSDQDDKACHPCHDHGEDTGVRNRYYRHKAMTAEDFRKEQNYMIDRRRLINRAVIGWGILNGGLRLELDGTGTAGTGSKQLVHVTQGVGLDQAGREIVVVEKTLHLTGQNTFLWNNGIFSLLCPERLHSDDLLLLRIHYAEEYCGDSYLPTADCCARPERRYIRESVCFSLTGVNPSSEKEMKSIDQGRIRQAVLAIKTAQPPHCRIQENNPKCPDGASDEPCTPNVVDRRACLDHWTNESSIEGGELCTFNGYRVAPQGLVLGVLGGVGFDKCEGVRATTVRCTDLRRIAKSNDLLYALQWGWDLTRITAISWKDWHNSTAEIPLTDFICKAKHEGLKITFSGPLDCHSVTSDCISVQFATSEGADSGWCHHYLVPNICAELCPEKKVLKIGFDKDWFDEIEKKNSIFQYRGATVTIEIYGDLILDVNGLAVDANARGAKAPGEGFETGNGTPGGTFRSTFKVGMYIEGGVKIDCSHGGSTSLPSTSI